MNSPVRTVRIKLPGSRTERAGRTRNGTAAKARLHPMMMPAPQ
jgi:hypothetical protein